MTAPATLQLLDKLPTTKIASRKSIQKATDIMTLQAEIDAAKRTVNTDTLSFSLNELIGMYENKEININPAFQRTFRWGITQQSDLIESLLIGVPLPPVFVYENTDGTWELIDGLQRTSTILRFFGKLRSPDDDSLLSPSVLVKTKYLPSLEGIVWEITSHITDVPIEQQRQLESAQQLFLKRCRINLEILKQPSSVNTKFDLFQRLNRGGSAANEQEIRTCSVVMRNSEFATLLSDLAGSDDFRTLCQLSDDDIKKQQDVEYATRLICHAYRDLNGREDLNEFLDRAIMEIIDTEDSHKVRRMFSETVDLIMRAAGDQALVPVSAKRKVFTLQGLESVLVGVARNIEAILTLADPHSFIKERVESFWTSAPVRVYTSSGMKASDRIKQTVPLGDNWFKPN